MNFVSLILYFGNVVDKLGPLGFVVGIFGVVFGFIVCIFIADSRLEDEQKMYRSARNWLLTIGIIALTMSILMPSKDVLYLIAASELGEEVVTNPEVVEVATELKDIILDKIRAVGE